MKIKDFIISSLLLLAACCCLGGWLLFQDRLLMFRMQEMNLFISGTEYLQSLMQYPGGMLSWMGCWCTEWMYLPAVGTGLLALLWWLTSMDICTLFRLRGPWRGLALLPAMALLAAIVQTGYWLYYIKLEGYLFVPTLGTLIAVLAAHVYRSMDIGRLWVRASWMTLWTAVSYPLFGAWGLAGTALMMLYELATFRNRTYMMTATMTGLGIALTGIVPQIWYQWWFGMTERSTLYMAGLPSFQYGAVNFTQYHWPYYALMAGFVLCAAVSAFLCHATATRRQNITSAIVTAAALAAGLWGINTSWYRDTNFQKELEITQAVEDLDWERVLTVYRRPSDCPPTRIMVMYKNLALFRLGRGGDEMFMYQNGGELQHAPWMVRMTQTGGRVMYYHYGKENFCYRWCMEDGVEFGWKVNYLKYLAKTSIINKDWEVARKYLNILCKTRFHRQWAERYLPYLYHYDLVEKDPEMSQIVPVLSGSDLLDGDSSLIELYLLNSFSRGHGANPMYQELTLQCALIVKDIDLFWPRFFQYATIHQGQPMPRYYQEAAYLYGMLEPGKVDISHMPFDDSVKETYRKFMEFNQQCGSMTEEQKAVAFRPQFGDTFYYFYFLERGIKTN